MRVGAVLKGVFRPTILKLCLVALFLLIAVGGLIQGSEFTPHKSRLLPVLRPFPLWVTFIYLIVPLAYIVAPLQAVGLSLLGGPAWFVVLVTVLYFYALSCLIAAAAHGVRRLFARLTRSV